MSFPRYPKYKDSGVEWLGEVPDHWDVTQLKRVVASDRQITYGIVQAGPQVEDGIPYIRPADMDDENGVHSLDGMLRTAPEIAAAYTRSTIREGDLVCSIGPSFGKVMVTPSWLEGANLTQGTARVAIQSPSVARYYFWVLRSGPSYAQWESSVGGATFRALNLGPLAETTIPVPTDIEQSTIAAFLDRETAKIDELVAEQRRLLELLSEEVNSLILSAFQSSNTKWMRVGYAADVISRPVLQKPEEIYTRLGLFNRGRGIFHKDPSEMDNMGESDFFWIDEGDLILSGQFAWEGAVALAGPDEAGCVVSHRYPVLRGKADVALTEYLLGLFCTEHGDFLLNENSRGSAGRNRPLNIGTLLKEKIPVADMGLQHKVADAIHTKKVLLKELSIQQDLLQERRTALISAAVTGQIDVRQLAGEVAA